MGAEDGAYGPLPAWTSREHWLAAFEAALSSPEGLALCGTIQVAAHKVVLVALCDAEAADHDTGRNLATSHATVAARTGLNYSAVRRAREVIVRLGFSRAVARGRRLRLEETRRAREAHGRSQTYAASTRALIMPRGSFVAVPTEHQPLPRNVHRSSSVLKNSPKRAEGRAKAVASRRPARTTKNRAKIVRETPRPLDVQRLAAAIVDRKPAPHRRSDAPLPREHGHRPFFKLSEHRHIGQVCDLIERHGLAGKGWTAAQLWHQIDLFTKTLRGGVTGSAERRDPVAFFAWLLKSAIPYGGESPSYSSAKAAEKRRAYQELQAQAEHDRRRDIEAQKDDIEAIIATMKRHRRRGARVTALPR